MSRVGRTRRITFRGGGGRGAGRARSMVRVNIEITRVHERVS